MFHRVRLIVRFTRGTHTFSFFPYFNHYYLLFLLFSFFLSSITTTWLYDSFFFFIKFDDAIVRLHLISILSRLTNKEFYSFYLSPCRLVLVHSFIQGYELYVRLNRRKSCFLFTRIEPVEGWKLSQEEERGEKWERLVSSRIESRNLTSHRIVFLRVDRSNRFPNRKVISKYPSNTLSVPSPVQ